MQVHQVFESHTLYVQNINDKIKIDTLKKSLYLLFSAYGDVIEVHLRKQRKYRGQAWVVFKFPKHCQHALTKLQNTPFYGKNLNLSIANAKSDIITKADGTYQTKANEKLAQLAKELENTMGDDLNKDSSTDAQKRKLEHSSAQDSSDPVLGALQRSEKNTSRPRYVVSDEPTTVLFAVNMPPSSQAQTLQFFNQKPTSIQALPPSDSTPIYDQLEAKNRDIPILLVTFSTIRDAEEALEQFQRYKFDDVRLKLAYCYDSKPLAAETDVQLPQ